MEREITKDDLKQFGSSLIKQISEIISGKDIIGRSDLHPGWIKSKKVRAMLDMSAATLQTLRISGKIRHKKVLGSYYYNEEDLKSLFK